MANRGVGGGRCRLSLAGRGLGVLFLIASQGCGDPRAVVAERAIDLGSRFQAASLLVASADGFNRPVRFRRYRAALEVTETGQALALSRTGALVVPIDPYVGNGTLRFDFRLDQPDESGTVSLRASLIDPDGYRRSLALLPSPSAKWAAANLSLGEGPNDYQFVVLEAVLGDGPESLRFRRPQLRLSGGRGMRTGRTQKAVPRSARGLPNVIIVILDAARASNFGVYGYERDTTPNIDGFADEGLVFRRAFSECPSTSCSIPTLISGIPFVSLGRPSRRTRLNDRMVTLAEYLADQGYRTIGLSANPNNSISRNRSQGFDEVVETWELEDVGDAARDPHRMSRRAIDALSRVEPTQPVFIQLHYVPPHEPYAPRPEFDVFGDPEYSGPVLPGVFIRDVARSQDRTMLSPPDVEEMVALYDGNLRMADDAVGVLFDALRKEKRWNNSIVLVTADHGEAFYEHGVQAHTTTLYDEMIHVPFMLRLPRRRDTSHVDTGRLVVLSDVVPTISVSSGSSLAMRLAESTFYAKASSPHRG